MAIEITDVPPDKVAIVIRGKYRGSVAVISTSMSKYSNIHKHKKRK